MRVTLDMAISPNGLIAREDGAEDWLPSEGWDDFIAEAKTFNNIVMGRETYEQVTARYKDYNFDAVEVDFKVIVTRNAEFQAPQGYTVVYSPEEAVSFLEKNDVPELFLIGGGQINAAFLKRKLVNRIQLSINPYIIGKGRSFVASEDFDAPLELVEHIALSGGRIRVKYNVVYALK